MGFKVAVDPRAEIQRQIYRQQLPRDLASGTMRWALHLSDIEAAYLEEQNPETLGRHDDERLRSMYWKRFIDGPDSAPFKIGTAT